MENWPLVGGAEPRADEHAGHELEHVLEIRGARLLDRLRGTRSTPPGVRSISRAPLLGAGALGRQGARLDDDRLQDGWRGRRLRDDDDRGEEDSDGREERDTQGSGHEPGFLT